MVSEKRIMEFDFGTIQLGAYKLEKGRAANDPLEWMVVAENLKLRPVLGFVQKTERGWRARDAHRNPYRERHYDGMADCVREEFLNGEPKDES